MNFGEARFGSSVHFMGWRSVSLNVKEGIVATSGMGIPTVSINNSNSVASARQIVAIRSLIHKLWLGVKRFLLGAKKVASGAFALAHRCLSRIQYQFSKSSSDTIVFPVFGAEAEFTTVDLASPGLVIFNQVDMSRVYLRGTNLRGVRLLNVNWWQPKLQRNGLYDELFIARSPDRAFRWGHLSVLEETYRNVRLALEENKNYVAAADCYVGELEAHRARLGFWKRMFFSVPAWYRFLTMYGTSVGRGIAVLAFLIVFHIIGTFIVQQLDIGVAIKMSPELLLRSIRLATLQQDDMFGLEVSLSQRWIDALYRIFTAIQVALLVFAFRTRIKRH